MTDGLERFYDLLTERTGIERPIDRRLEFAARFRAQEAITQVGYDFVSHEESGIPHPTWTERLHRLDWVGPNYTAELAIWGYFLDDEIRWATDGLMASSPHRSVLVNTDWTHWGAGIYREFGGTVQAGSQPSDPINERHYFVIWLSMGVPRMKVIVSVGTGYADALAASYLVNKYSAPLMLVGKSNVSQAVREQLSVLKPTEILLIGGIGVIDESVEALLSTYAPVRRIAGADRYETAVEISKA